ncbi:MAG: purine-nucleoside phosphorylase [Planctomycetota bacterium]
MLHLSPRSLALRTVVSDLQQRLGMVPDAAIVLGSGLGGFVDRMDVTQRIAYHDLPGLPASSAGGHAGEFVLGQFGGKTIIAMAGRLHRYEGHSMQTVTMPVLSMVGLGATQLIVSNAAGGLNPNYRVGDLVCITDHIDWTMPMRDQRQVGNTQRAAAAQTRWHPRAAACGCPSRAY